VIRISFQNDAEALTLLQMIANHRFSLELSESILFIPRQGIEFDMEEQDLDKWLTLLTDVFHRFLIEEKLEQVREQIIIQKFYFHERDEIDSILQFAASIFEGKESSSQQPLFDDEKQWIKKGLSPILREQRSFSFDAFTIFRLKSFYQSLEKYAMLAIDEYKLEQDYQNFIATLRDFLHKREPKMSYLHLVYRDAFHFYDHSFRKLERVEMTEKIDRQLLSQSSIYIDSVTLAPLLSIAPERLYIYTDDTEQTFIQTVKRIFEERSFVLPLDAFKEKGSEEFR
jgi:putative sporulation protein YtxC